MTLFYYFFSRLGAKNYEQPHQLIIRRLAEYPEFLNELTGIRIPGSRIERETNGRLFDFSVFEDNTERICMEIKVKSPLKGKQFHRQVNHVKENGCKLIYLLLGLSADEWSKARFKRVSKAEIDPVFLSYAQLFRACRKLLNSLPKDAIDHQLTSEYLKIIEEQYKCLQDADLVELSEAPDKRYWYYARFRRVKEAMEDWTFITKTGDLKKNKSFTLHQHEGWLDYEYNGIKAQLLLEIIDNELCVRAHTSENDKYARPVLRSHLQEQLRKHLNGTNKVVDSNRDRSDYMKVVRMKLPPEGLSVEAYCKLLRDTKEQMLQISD